MKCLKTGQVCDYLDRHYDVSEPTFQKWIVRHRYYFTSYAGGEGQGDHRLFTFNQVVGLCVGIELRRTTRSCPVKSIGKIMDAFGQLSEGELSEMLLEGRTHFVDIASTMGPDHVELQTEAMSGVDVHQIWRGLTEYVQELERQGKRLAKVSA